MPETKIPKEDSQRWEEFTIVNVYPDKDSSPKGKSGKYQVKIALTTAVNLSIEDIHPPTPQDGDTDIIIYSPELKTETTPVSFVLEATVHDEIITFDIKANNDGRLSYIESGEFEAENFRDSIIKAFKFVSPVLSKISFLTDSPLAIKIICAEEVDTKSIRIYCLPSPMKKVFPYNFLNKKELNTHERSLLGLYREALNSINSPLYQLFCYFKIMDGFGHIQADRISKKLSNIVVEEIMPPGHKYSGKRFNYIKNQINKDFRTAFAHFNLNQDSIDQSPDDMKYIYEAIFTIPDCQFIARKYIEAILSQT